MGQYYIYILQFVFYVFFILIPMLKMRKTLKEKEEKHFKEKMEWSNKDSDKFYKYHNDLEQKEAQIVSLKEENKMLKENFTILKNEIYGKKD